MVQGGIAFYDQEYSEEEEKLHPYKLELLSLLPPNRGPALDAGSGSGLVSQRIAALGYTVQSVQTVQGVDVSARAVER
jgi:SAM-dependent methyltransferase